MSITASAITPDKSLEEFRVEFNKLIQDFEGVASGNTFTQTIVFEGVTADAFETTVSVIDPTADNVIELPNVGAAGTNPGSVEGNARIITTMNASDPTTTTSSGDANFVLVSDGGALKKITPANLGIGGSAGSVAADDITTGDAAVTLATSTGNITIDAQGGDTDIIFKGTDGSSDITALTLDMSDAGKAIFNGAISATTITLSADGGLLLPNDGNIGSAGSTAAMQISSGGIVTFADDILIKDGGTIGVASSTSAITIASTGIVTLVDDLILKDAATIGVTSSTSAISIASTGIVTFIDDIVIKDAGTIGSASAPTAMSISSGGIVTFLDDILIKDGGTIGSASSTSAITIASTGIVTLVDDLVLKDACTIGTATTAGAVSIAADGTVNLATAGATVNSAIIKTAGTETLYVPAAAMYPTTTNGCAALTQVELTAGRPELKCLDFDPSSDENAQFTVAFPKSWNAGDITFRAYFTVSGTDTGTVKWELAGISQADDGAIDTAFPTGVGPTAKAHSGVSGDINITAVSGAITITGAGDDEMTFFQIQRDTDDDNQTGDARLLGIQIFFTTSATNDA